MPKIRVSNLESGIVNQMTIDMFEANNESEQLALNAEQGDYCKRLDTGDFYVNKTGTNNSMSDWEWLSKDHTSEIEALSSSTDVKFSSLSAENLKISINQSTHGFSVGNLLYLNSSTYTKAIATSSESSEIIGIVLDVIDADNFVMCLPGSRITGLTGLTAGSIYYLSDTTAGEMTTSEPTTFGYISKPVLIADSTTSGIFVNYRGIEVFN